MSLTRNWYFCTHYEGNPAQCTIALRAGALQGVPYVHWLAIDQGRQHYTRRALNWAQGSHPVIRVHRSRIKRGDQMQFFDPSIRLTGRRDRWEISQFSGKCIARLKVRLSAMAWVGSGSSKWFQEKSGKKSRLANVGDERFEQKLRSLCLRR